MKHIRIYSRRIMAGGKRYTIFTSKERLEAGFGVEIHSRSGYRSYVREEQVFSDVVDNSDIVSLPDEQSWSTFFPLNYLLLGRKRIAAQAADEITQLLRRGNSPVKCFHDGCRKQAVFYAEAPSSGGHWFACSDQHMSNVTTKGVLLPKGSYKPVGALSAVPTYE